MVKTTRKYQMSALGNKKENEVDAPKPNPPKRQKKARSAGWADALLKFLDDPSDSAVVYLDDEVMAIKDKFPKAKHHYLVMPRDTRYASIGDLTPDDMPLLKHMERVANKLVNDNNTIHDENESPDLEFPDYKYGFHAVPSMNHLHMHVISQDLDSSCLRHKKHWNSFTTTFFVPLEEMMIAVESGEAVDFSYRSNRLSDGLKCHHCGKAQISIPKLKEHIRSCESDC